MYITIIRNQNTPTVRERQLDMESLVRSVYQTHPEEVVVGRRVDKPYFETITHFVEPQHMPLPPAGYLDPFVTFQLRYQQFVAANPDESKWYTHFYLPKKSGGMREIHAPIPELADLQRSIVHYLSHVPGKALPTVHAHNAAFGYVTGRSSLRALQIHTNSNWFLKLDIKDFFPSCTSEMLVDVLANIYPTAYIPREIRQELMKICTRNNVLPQGAPSSPWLSNMVLLPLDHGITRATFNHNGSFTRYTRYADDLLLSSVAKETLEIHIHTIVRLIRERGFEINREKTRLGSIAGSNWNLGLMLNKEHHITLGHEKKQRIRAMVFNFLKDAVAGTPWDKNQSEILQGQMAYYSHIEPTYVQYVIDHYSEKTGVNFYVTLKQALQ